MSGVDKSEPTCIPSVLLWGGGSKARLIEAMLRECGAGIARVIFDPIVATASFQTSVTFVNDVSVLAARIRETTHYVVCIGAEHGYARYHTAQYLERLGLRSLTLAHERSFVDPSAILDRGCQVMPCAVIHKFSRVGAQSIVNTNATIDHECVIGRGVHVMGSAAIAGRVTVGDYATIGTNATILPAVTIGEGAYVGAGAVVTRNVAPYTVVAGVPAKLIRTHVPKFFEEPLLRLLDAVSMAAG